MATELFHRWVGGFALERTRLGNEQKLAAVLDSCLERMAEGRELTFPLQRAPEEAAEVRPLLEIVTLLQLRGRLHRQLAL